MVWRDRSPYSALRTKVEYSLQREITKKLETKIKVVERLCRITFSTEYKE